MLNCGAQCCSPCIFLFVRMRSRKQCCMLNCGAQCCILIFIFLIHFHIHFRPHAQKGQLMMIHKSTALLVRSAAFLPRRWRPRGPGTCAAV
jgi:hypothetical protein